MINKELAHLATILCLRDDSKAILSLMKTERDPIVSLGVIPYYSMFYIACSEYLAKYGNYQRETRETEYITEIRNHIKDFNEKYSKTNRYIIKKKEEIETYYLNLFSVGKIGTTVNFYDLGIYFDKDKHIVGDTYTAYLIHGVSDKNKNISDNKHFNSGHELGQFVNSVYVGLSKTLGDVTINRTMESIKIPYYFDLSTNKHHMFLNETYEISQLLFFLSILSRINFYRFVISKMLSNDCSWKFRIKYTISHYTAIALNQYVYHQENNNSNTPFNLEIKRIINDLITNGKGNSEIRNFIIHYETDTQIETVHFEKPFYGLLDAYLIDTDYQTLSVALDRFLQEVSDLLTSLFDTSSLELKVL